MPGGKGLTSLRIQTGGGGGPLPDALAGALRADCQRPGGRGFALRAYEGDREAARLERERWRGGGNASAVPEYPVDADLLKRSENPPPHTHTASPLRPSPARLYSFTLAGQETVS